MSVIKGIGIAVKGIGKALKGKPKKAAIEMITVKPSGKKSQTAIYKMKQSSKNIEKTFKDITKKQKAMKEKLENAK